MLAIAVPVTLAYQTFRMGFYGNLAPQTAIAEIASGSQWGQGWNYVTGFMSPYTLGITLSLVVIVGLISVVFHILAFNQRS